MYKFRLCVISVLMLCGCHGHSTSSSTNNSQATQDTINKHAYANLKPLAAGVIIDSVQCVEDLSQYYSIYLPSNYSNAKKWPVIYFFDPHGVGNLPINVYKDLAEKYGYIIAGTYGSKNGMKWDASEKAASAFMDDISQRLSVDKNRFYTFGFSGGARVACSYALYDGGIAGVAACGGGFPQNNPNITQPFACILFVGDRDFNYAELKQLDRQLDPTPLPHQLEIFHGRHQWPPAPVAEEAFQWFSLCAMRSGLTPKNDSIIKSVEQNFLHEVDKWRKSKNDIQLYFIYKKMLNFLRNLIEVGTYATAEQELGTSEKVKKYLDDQKVDERQEANVQQQFINYMSDKNEGWWQSTVKELRDFINKDSNASVALQNQRLLSFLSLATYMGASHAYTSQDDQSMARFLNLYALVDPTNPEHSYLYACLYARQNNMDKAMSSLQDAVKLGFVDVKRMESEVYFAPIKDKAEFKELVKKMSTVKPKIDLTQ